MQWGKCSTLPTSWAHVQAAATDCAARPPARRCPVQRAKQLHPDLIVVATQNSSAKGSNKEDAAAFLALAAAYEVLSDKARRSAYDAATANKSAKDAHTSANAAIYQATHTAATANASAGEAGAH